MEQVLAIVSVCVCVCERFVILTLMYAIITVCCVTLLKINVLLLFSAMKLEASTCSSIVR